MKSILMLPMFLLGACSSKDDISITAHQMRCIKGDPKSMMIKISDYEGSRHISIYGDINMQNSQQGCQIIVDKKTNKIVNILLYQ